jgi:hypothetical protein
VKKPPPPTVTLARLADFIARGQRAQEAAADAASVAPNAAIVRQRMEAEVARLRKRLHEWIEQHTHRNDVEITHALLEAAFERQIDLHGEQDALDLVQSAFRRTAKKLRPPLQ